VVANSLTRTTLPDVHALASFDVGLVNSALETLITIKMAIRKPLKTATALNVVARVIAVLS
jgi:hypothetical protein